VKRTMMHSASRFETRSESLVSNMKKIFFFVRHCFNDTQSSFADKCSGLFLSVRPAARARARRRYVRARDCRGIPMAKCETKKKEGFFVETTVRSGFGECGWK